MKREEAACDIFSDYDERLSRLASSGNVRIITDHGNPDRFRYIRRNVAATTPAFLKGNRIIQGIALGFRIYREGLRWKKAAFVTLGSEHGFVLAAIQCLFSPLLRPRPHVMFDCLWEPGRTTWQKLFLRIKVAIVNSAVDTCVVYGVPDVENFHASLGIKKSKIRFLLYHNSLEDFECPCRDGEYVFTGGTEGREFDPLIETCLDLGIPLRIATWDEMLIRRWAGHPAIHVASVTPLEFATLMAESRFVVVPHGKTLLRTGGHQTFINALWMGKAVILYNSDIAKGYVTHGKDAVVLPYGDRSGLRTWVRLLYNSCDLRQRLGRKGKHTVFMKGLTPQMWARRVYNLATRNYRSV
jgi:glycosyltransferase involved in cell wall biosynthesis